MQKLTRLLSSRLYKVEYELYPETKCRLIEEFPSSANSSSNRYSTHFSSNAGSNNNSAGGSNTASGRALSGVVGGNPRVKVRSRHLSMQGNPRHGGGSLKRGVSGRPLSACGSEGQLTDMKPPEKQQHGEPQEPQPEGSVSTILRNLSSASLSDIANTFKTDRKSTNLTASVVDEEGEEEHAYQVDENHEHAKQSIKFGIKKNIIPSASFSNTPSSSIHSSSNIQPSSTSIGKRSNTNNSGNSLTGGSSGNVASGGGSGTSLGGGHNPNNGTSSGGGEKSVSRRAISIQQLDTLWQDSGSKLLNFVHHGDINASPQISSSKAGSKDEEKKGVIDWDHASGSSIEEMSTKVSYW